MNPQTRQASQPQPPADSAPRFDIYGAIHRAWRLFMVETLGQVGRLDVDDADAMAATLDQVELLCLQLRRHVAHENEFLHPALEAAAAGSARPIADEHVSHLDTLASLEDQVQALRQVAPAQRSALARRLYRLLALFVAENFEHMEQEERVHNPLLWAHYSDAQLLALDGRIIASLDPQEMALSLQWITRALPPQDLAALLAGARPGMPAEAFDGLLGLVRQTLDAQPGPRLARTLACLQALDSAQPAAVG